MSVRFRICLIAWITVLAITIVNQHASAQTQELTPVPEEVTAPPAPAIEQLPPASEAEWQITIQPSLTVSTANSGAQPADCENCDRTSIARDYATVYKSIPFNRAEYNVNPSYRHDATMEILTGNARHATVVRHQPVQPVTRVPRGAAAYPALDALNPARFGYLRPGLRLNYYKHFPSLNPYVNFWNYTGAF